MFKRDSFSIYNLSIISFARSHIIKLQFSPENRELGITFDRASLTVPFHGEVKATIEIKNVVLKVSHWSELEIKAYEEGSALGIKVLADALKDLQQITEIAYQRSLWFKGFFQNGELLECLFENPAIELTYDQIQLRKLFEAVEQGNFSVIQKLINQGVDLNQPLIIDGFDSVSTDYVLIAAVKTGNFDLVRFLVEKGADVNVQSNSDGETPLICSFRNNENEKITPIAKYLIEAGADVNSQGGFCQTPLMQAIHRDHREMVLFLINHGADVNFFLHNVDENESRATPIHQAIYSNNAYLTELLISHGARLDMEDTMGLPLNEAAAQGNLEIILMLLNKGADINHLSYWGTALFEAARYGKIEAVKLLLEQGADVHIKNDMGETALFHAISGGAEVTKLLIEHGADVHSRDNRGETALFKAARYDKIEVVKLLLEQGADVHIKNDKEETALFEAACYGRVEIAKLLLQHGADKQARNKKGETPFLLIVRRATDYLPLECQRSMEQLLLNFEGNKI